MVVIKSKMQRRFWSSVILGVIPDIAIAAAASAFWGFGLIGFVALFVGLNLLYAAIWAKGAIWSWTIFQLFRKKTMAKHLEDFLVSNRFTRPPRYVGSIEEYLSEVAGDDKNDCRLRCVASTELGVFQGLKVGQRYSMSIQIGVAFEEALERYGQRFHYDDDDGY